jgi:hypothetical protein
MVAVAIFTDKGQVFLMGNNLHSATHIVQKAMSNRGFDYIQDETTRLRYLEHAICLMNGTIEDKE